MKKLLNEIAGALCVMAVCVFAGCSYAGDGASSSVRGGLVGTPTNGQTQGVVVKESWMDTDGNILISTNSIVNTSEVVVVPTGTVATIAIPDDSSWNGFIAKNEDRKWKGVFIKDRKVKLDSFVMSQYEVTEQLYAKVMEETDTPSTKPKGSISWYGACAFCNELTKNTISESECVYYNDQGQVYSAVDASNRKSVVIAGKSFDTTTRKWIKKGYRLPTEAEWEYAARGGDPNARDAKGNYIWNYAYSGVNSSVIVVDSSKAKQGNYATDGNLKSDDNANDYVIYDNENKVDVGTKSKNRLNLYDVSGNVSEWCYDFNNVEITKCDIKDSSGYVLNPLGASSSDNHVYRGGSFKNWVSLCIVSRRGKELAESTEDPLGIRLVRSTN